MWIMTKTGFISVVQKPGDNKTLTVRARVAGQIESIFPCANVKDKGGTDYAYRAQILRAEVAKVISDQIMNIHYSNFKNAIPDNAYHDACAGVWNVMMRYQIAQSKKRQPTRSMFD